MNRKPTYSELLKDPQWQKVRLKKLEGAEWRCELCYDESTMLSVHHKRYVKGRMPWEYEAHELVVLCQPCHELNHEAIELRSELISRLHIDGPAGADDFFALGAGYISQQTNDEGMAQVAARFAKDRPYQYGLGRFLAQFERYMRLSLCGLNFMQGALDDGPGNPFFDELDELLKKHGVQVSLRGAAID